MDLRVDGPTLAPGLNAAAHALPGASQAQEVYRRLLLIAFADEIGGRLGDAIDEEKHGGADDSPNESKNTPFRERPIAVTDAFGVINVARPAGHNVVAAVDVIIIDRGHRLRRALH